MSEIYHDDTKKLPPADEDSRLVVDNFERCRQELITEAYTEKCKTAHKTYRAIVEEESGETDDLITTDLVVPLAFEHIESIHPRMLANNPRIEVWGRGKEDELRASQHRALLMYYWQKLQIQLLLLDLNKQALITGTGWAKVYWRRETRRRKMVRFAQPSFMGLPVPGVPPVRQEFIGDAVVYDLPQVDLLDNDEVFPDPDGYSIDTCDWVIHRRLTTLAELEALDWPDKGAMRQLKERVGETNTKADPILTISEELNREVGSEASTMPDPHKRQLHLLERWDDERVIVVVEEHPEIKPLRKEFHGIGMKPFVRYTPIPVPKKLLGVGMVEILYPFIIEISSIHQARVDNVKHVIHKMVTIREGSQINPKQLVRRPGGYIDVIEHDDIKPLDLGDVHFSAYRETEALALEAQRTSGANDIVQGVGGPRAGGTATQAQLLAQATASRTTLMFKVLSEQCLKRLGRLLVRLSDLNMTTPRMVQIAGSDYADTEFQNGLRQIAENVVSQGGVTDQDLSGLEGLLANENPNPGFTEVTPEGLVSGSDVDLDLTIDVAEADPEVRVTRQQRAINAIQTLGQLLHPLDPLLTEFKIMLAEGFGVERAEQKVQAGNQMMAQQLQQQQAQQGGQSGVETAGDQLAVDASQSAPTGDRQVVQ